MSSTNAEAVGAVVEAQQRRAWRAFRRLYDTNIECMTILDRGGLGHATRIRGGSGGMGNLVRSVREVDLEIEELVESGNAVVAVTRSRGRGRRSSVVTGQRTASVWTVRGGFLKLICCWARQDPC